MVYTTARKEIDKRLRAMGLTRGDMSYGGFTTAREFYSIFKELYSKDSTIRLVLKEAKQTMILDPNAVSYTDDQIIGKINNATTTITRVSCVDAAARPIGIGEITDTKLASDAVTEAKIASGAVTINKIGSGAVNDAKLASGAAKSNLDAMSDTARGYIKTSPTSGQYKVIEIQRQSDGKLAVAYDDVSS